MDLLIKLTGTETATSTVGESNFKAHFPSINKNMSWASIKPYIRQATEEYLLPYLGDTLHEAIIAWEGDEAPADLNARILDCLRDALAAYTIYEAMPHINIVLSDMGAQENASENNTSQPASQWRFKNARWAAMIKADKMLDKALSLLETMEDEEDSTTFADWKEWSLDQGNKSELFDSAKTLSQVMNISTGRRAYLALLPYFKKALNMKIIPAISKEQYDAIIANPTENEYFTEAFEKIRYAVAEYGYYLAIPHLRIAFDGQSVVFVTSTDGMNMTKDAHQDAINDLKQRTLNDADTALASLTSYLYKNHAEFSHYDDLVYIEYHQDTVIRSSDGVGGIMIN